MCKTSLYINIMQKGFLNVRELRKVTLRLAKQRSSMNLSMVLTWFCAGNGKMST